jgi:hypothetical protein
MHRKQPYNQISEAKLQQGATNPTKDECVPHFQPQTSRIFWQNPSISESFPNFRNNFEVFQHSKNSFFSANFP